MSLFKQFIHLRDQLSNLTSQNVDFLNKLTDSSTEIIQNAKMPISEDRNLQIIDGKLQLRDKPGNILKQIDLTSDQDVMFERLQEIADSNTGETFGDLIDQVSSGANLYQLAADLTSKFAYSSRVSYSDVMNYINDYPVQDTAALKDNLFAATNDDGFITKPAFISVLNSWLLAGKDASDDQSFDVDKTNPYGLSNVINVLVSVVGQVFSALCYALSMVFGALLALVGGIFNLLGNMFAAMKEVEHLEFDPSVGNNYIKGPVLIGDPLQSDVSVYNTSDIGGSVYVSESRGIALFLWRKGSMEYKANAYLYPHYKGFELIRDLLADGQIIITSPWTTSSRTSIPEPLTVLAFADSSSGTYVYGDNECPTNTVELALSLAMGHLIQTIAAADKNGNADREWKWNGAGGIAFADDEKLISTIDQMLNLIRFKIGQLQTKDQILNSSEMLNMSDNFANAYANYLKSYNIPNRQSVFMRASGIPEITVRDTSHSFDFPMLYAIMFGHSRLGVVNGSVDLDCNSYGKDGFEQVDCLPVQQGLTLPQFDQRRLNAILSISAIAVTITAIAFSQLKKVIVKRSYSRQALRAADVNQARANFLADPTNVELRKEYENKVYRYNKLGKWFGWGTYDGANGWVNYDNSTSQSEMEYKLKSLYDNQLILKQIKALIKD